ncbi:hypothetical protein EJ08DRAFT_734484 [Tothia fuscella]|uniref:MD-2-related lipid-recognition domain-containing protein n=1 Tax=Tothia fuscella TaxID=1048955 RepID=A0A9P4NQU6_9PEZI|nr:hypothetical protein EJ08DRAFT_734484 [Tothia fuscella]
MLKYLLSTMPVLILATILQQPLLDLSTSRILTSVPGETPFKLCPATQPTDLYNISSITLYPQPLYIDDDFTVHIYGTFLESIEENSTMHFWVDCGSHCKEYGLNHTEGDGYDFPLEEIPLEQPNKRIGFPADKGYGHLWMEFAVMPFFLQVPGWYNFTFDARTISNDRIFCVTAEVCLRWEDEKRNEGYPKGPWSSCRWP